MKQIFDLFVGVILLTLLAIPMLLIAIVIRLTSKGLSLYWSDRVGKNNRIFKIPKFRSMLANTTPAVVTHLLDSPNSYLSLIGSFLRRSSLDELPQVFSALKGDMSFVRPRPALYNQDDLVALRTQKGVDKLLPGITGWAEVNGRDELSISEKVSLDVEYLNRQSFWFDMKILWITFLKVIPLISQLLFLSRINKKLAMLLINPTLFVSILLAPFSIRLGYWHFPESDFIWVRFGYILYKDKF